MAALNDNVGQVLGLTVVRNGTRQDSCTDRGGMTLPDSVESLRGSSEMYDVGEVVEGLEDFDDKLC